MKRYSRVLAVCAVVVAGVMVGCDSTRRSDCIMVQGFGPETPQAVTTAPASGEYVLYRGNDSAPIARNYVKAGEEVGFKVDALDMDKKPVGPKGTVSAVAGELAFPINATEKYEWRRIKGSDHETVKQNPYLIRP